MAFFTIERMCKMIKTWKEFVQSESHKPYFQKMTNFLDNEYTTKTIFPEVSNVFNAFHYTPLEQVKIVILGQDPYQTPGFANGLAFSVQKGVALPKSLQNIYKELWTDLGIRKEDGDLSSWAQHGILLLNTILTVEMGKSLSHQNIGWEEFTDNVLKLLNQIDRPLVFILWGNKSKAKMSFLNNPKHLIITSAHPSPLSAYNGFFGSKPFSRACAFLQEPIEIWK